MENNGLVAKLLAWGPAIIILIALLTGMVLNSNVDSVAEDSTEMAQTSVYLDSPTSLRTIIVTLNRQYVKAEEQWMQALSTSTFLLFLVSVMALAMWGRLLHLRRQQQENQAKQNKKDES